MRVALAAVVFLAAACSSGTQTAPTTTTAGVAVPVSVVGLGRNVTWDLEGSTRCDLGDVRVKAEADGETITLTTVAFAGQVDATGQRCVSEPETVEIPPVEFVTFTLSGAGPLGADWVSSGDFTLAEAQAGVTATARG